MVCVCCCYFVDWWWIWCVDCVCWVRFDCDDWYVDVIVWILVYGLCFCDLFFWWYWFGVCCFDWMGVCELVRFCDEFCCMCEWYYFWGWYLWLGCGWFVDLVGVDGKCCCDDWFWWLVGDYVCWWYMGWFGWYVDLGCVVVDLLSWVDIGLFLFMLWYCVW